MAENSPPEQNVSYYAWRWFGDLECQGVDALNAAREYLVFLDDNRLLVESVHVSIQQFCNLGPGCLVLESCGASTVAKGANAKSREAGGTQIKEHDHGEEFKYQKY